jgi:predicted RNA-binding Zn-ribbon protein involved in translation (DUF1610 family)
MKEKKCPICLQPIRSDALTKHYCKLCGMNIDLTTPKHTFLSIKDERQHFCCPKCLTTYIRRIYQENEHQGTNS